MNKLLIIVCASCLIFGCRPSPEELKQRITIAKENAIREKKSRDSLQREVKLIMDIESGKVLKDTIGLHKAPIEILSSEIVKHQYGSYKNIKLVYKNVSKKTINAIKFRWRGLDSFGDPAEMGGSYDIGIGGGFTDETLKPGKSGSGTWEILSRNAKKVTIAWPIEIVFSDDTKWFINNHYTN